MKLFGKNEKSNPTNEDSEIAACGGCASSNGLNGNRCCNSSSLHSDCDNTAVIYRILCGIQSCVANMGIPGFSVDVEITVDTGVIYDVTFSSGTLATAKVTKCTLITSQYNILLSSITKIVIDTSALSNTQFTTLLTNQITCMLTDGACHGGASLSGCASCLQDFINANKLDIDSINYVGGYDTIESISLITGVETIDVVGSATLQQTGGTVVTSVNPVVATGSVVGTVIPANINVVTTVPTIPTPYVSGIASTATTMTPLTATPISVVGTLTTTPSTVVTGVTATPATVAGPFTLTPTAISSVATAAGVDTVVTSVGTATSSVVGSISTETASALTGLGTPSPITGVLTGITGVATASTDATVVPSFTTTGTGVLNIVIPANTFGTGTPAVDTPFPVVLGTAVGGPTISYNGDSTVFTLPTDTTVLSGITGTPTSSTISVPTAPATAAFINLVVPSPATVIGSVTPVASTGFVVTGVTTSTVNIPTFTATPTVSVVGTIAAPTASVNTVVTNTTATVQNVTAGTPISVITSVTPTGGTINTVGTVMSEPVASLFTASPTTVVTSANIFQTATSGVYSANLTTIPQTVVESINSSTVSVLAPVNEEIDGSVICAANGIMAVNNTNGDISLYSVCDINSVNTLPE